MSAENELPVGRALAALGALLHDRCATSTEVCQDHAIDVSRHAPAAPDGVVFPQTADEVVEIARICSEHQVPMIPYGTATGVEGGVIATHGGISIDLTRMNQVLRISRPDADVTVQAGVTRKQLNQVLQQEETGLYFPVDPGADASLGGMAATSASGSSAVRYGTMRDNVLGLRAVLADGSLVRTGSRARKSSAGYDLTRLLVGSEGTLAIITELTLRLYPVPAAMSAAICQFPSIASAVETAIELLGTGIPVARMELLDETLIDAVNQYCDLQYDRSPTLCFEFHGTPAHVTEQAEQAEQIAGRHGGLGFQWATDAGQREQLWQARYDAYYACLALRENAVAYVTDVCVPVSELATCISDTQRALESVTVPAPLFGHVGDGNFHVVLIVDPDSPEELATAQELNRWLIARALAAGGTCTGEHGIGLGKQSSLVDEFGPAVEMMQRIKRALDPHNLMNPGKVLQMSAPETTP
ncbi:MAG: FAD-linked oxidase C-terminal domain-containing protein [Pirellulaceae bacterium]